MRRMRRVAALLVLLLVAPTSAAFEERFGQFHITEDDGILRVEGKFLEFTADARPQMTDLLCGGRPMVAAVVPPSSGEVQAEALNRAAFVDADGNRMVVLQDDARCSLQVKSTSAGQPLVAFPNSLSCSGEQPVRCQGAGHTVVMHVDGMAISGAQGYTIEGHATILSSRPSALGAAYDDALEEGRVGAEVTLGSVQGFVFSQTVTVGDMRVDVTGTPGNLTARIASDDPAGRAITFELDPSQYTNPNVTVFEVEPGERREVATVGVATAEDLFATAPDQGIPVLRSNGTIVVYFHHYSEKEVNIEEAVAEGVRLGLEDAFRDAPLPVWALVAGLALVVAARRSKR